MLHLSECDMMKKCFDLAGIILVAIDTEGRVSAINETGSRVLGYARQDIIGRVWFDIFVPERLRSAIKAGFAELIAGRIKPTEHFENPILTKDGEERLISWRNAILRDVSGRIVGTLSSGEDTTERKQVDDALKKSEMLYRSLIETTGTGYVILDLHGKVVDANSEYVRLSGHRDLKSVRGHSVVEWTAKREKEKNVAALR
jgi:PAS domain S-box-containing protein